MEEEEEKEEEKEKVKEEEELEAAGWCSEAGDEEPQPSPARPPGNWIDHLHTFPTFQKKQKVNKDVWRKQVTKTAHQNFAYVTHTFNK